MALPTLSGSQPFNPQPPTSPFNHAPNGTGVINPFAAKPQSPPQWAAGMNPNLGGANRPNPGGGGTGSPPIYGGGQGGGKLPSGPGDVNPPVTTHRAHPIQQPSFSSQGPGGTDRNGFPAIAESGPGWVKYSDGGIFRDDSAAGQKAQSMVFGTTASGTNLDAMWGKVPLSWRANMAQDWSPDAIKSWLDGAANPNAYFVIDGQKMLGSQMASYVDNKMTQAINQAKQNVQPKPAPNVNNTQVMAGIG